ncbi:thiamine pyrophosphokinase [Algoriphagus sp. A40]|uniref:thiamine pyrophosphokinase n=1 Tax=Algoriphagus sp. A40 TaxID=1945863 RepID=UPI000986692F|nr:thiamine pyrophosphokinase [Algoriphagus sp. A40]OOG73334.1 thiamine pyrophosphokinase [Algoriphagus sp. A40]
MSSHHFVKDQQEPAVFILDTAELSFETVSPLLEWVPTVLVGQECLENVLSWGIKVDLILATETFQKDNLHLLEEQYPVKFLTASPENTLDEGLQYLLATKHPATHLVGLSHLKHVDLGEKLELFDLTIMDAGWKYYPVKSGKFKKWFAESTIRILGKEGMPVEISNENGKLMLPLVYLTQLEVPEGITEIAASGVIWIGEEVK